MCGWPQFYPWQVTPVKDGYFEVITMVDDQWNRFLDLLGDPEWRDDERLKNRWLSFQHAEELDALWHPWMRERTKAELWEQFSENRISFQPVHTIGEVVESEHLQGARVLDAGGAPELRGAGATARRAVQALGQPVANSPARADCWGSTLRK